MKKENNDWSIEETDEVDADFKCQPSIVNINGEKYYVHEDLACLAHAILLLVDAINDKKVL
jgi:hypothetical protein